MKRLLLLFSATVAMLCAYAQNKKIDSLNNLIAKAPTDTALINLLVEKANAYTENNLDSAIAITQHAAARAKRIQYVKGEAKAYRIAGIAFNYKGDFPKALASYTIAEQLYKEIKDSAGISAIYGGYGMYYGMQSKYDSSILFYKKQADYYEKNGTPKQITNTYQNLAVSYTMLSNYRSAINYQTKALQLAESTHDTTSMAYINLNMAINYSNMHDYPRSQALLLKAVMYAQHAQIKNVELYGYANLATAYKQLGNYQKSYDYAMKAVTLGRQLGDLAMVSSSLARAGEALAVQKKFAEAEQLCLQAIALADSVGSPLNNFQTLVAMGFIKKAQQQYPSAIAYYEKGFAALKDADLYDEQIGDAYKDLAESYEKEGIYQKALNAFKISTNIGDSIRSRENIRKTTELMMNADFAKKEQAQQLARQEENAANRLKLVMLIVVLLVFITLSAVALIGYRRAQKAKALIKHQKQQVEHTLEELKITQAQLIQSEKMASLGELTAGIAHEIKNPLNFVNNFSEVSQELLEEMEEELALGNMAAANSLSADVKQNLQKIVHHGKRADAIVKGMLQHSRNNTGKRELIDINALCDEYLKLSYYGLRAKDQQFSADLQTAFDNSIDKISIIPQDIGRVLLNLFTNAFYAVHKKQKTADETYQPTVVVETTKDKGSIKIYVKDNGNGIPAGIASKIFQPFFTTKPTGEGTGLGLSLSYDIITKEHGGTLTMHSQEGEYAAFVITLPA